LISRMIRLTFLLALMLVMTAMPNRVFAEGVEEYRVKAAFLYNFAKFVDWPQEAFASPRSPVVVCIFGEDPFGGAVEPLLGKAVGERQLSVKRSKRLEEIPGCQIVFVSSSEKDRLQAVFQAARSAQSLTVSDIDDFAQLGGMIGMLSSEGKIRFRVNVKAAKASGIQISSKLLKLADSVIE
jgi:hypothetical protein